MQAMIINHARNGPIHRQSDGVSEHLARSDGPASRPRRFAPAARAVKPYCVSFLWSRCHHVALDGDCWPTRFISACKPCACPLALETIRHATNRGFLHIVNLRRCRMHEKSLSMNTARRGPRAKTSTSDHRSPLMISPVGKGSVPRRAALTTSPRLREPARMRSNSPSWLDLAPPTWRPLRRL